MRPQCSIIYIVDYRKTGGLHMNKKSFQHKLFFYIAISLAVLLCLLGCFAFFYVNRALQEDTVNNTLDISNSTTSNIDNLLEEMNKLALYASTNPEVRETMTTFYYLDELPTALLQYDDAVIEILTSITVPNSASSFRISILNSSNFFETTGIPTSTSYTNNFLYTDAFTEWYDSLPIISNNKSITFEKSDPWTGTETEYITLYREIFNSSTTTFDVGIVMIQCPVSQFINLLSFEDETIEGYIFDEDGTLLFTNNSDTSTNYISTLTSDEVTELLNSESSFRYNNIYTVASLSNEWQLLIVHTQDTFTTILFPIIIYLLCGFSILIILTLLILYVIMNRATKPLQQLIAQVEDVSLNNLSINTEETSFDEFELLNNAFSDMFHRLRSSMDENEKRKTYELQANLIALQSQMDPHFLYNMLAVIKSMNREQNHEQVDYCCNYLARMLRYISIYDESSVILTKELEHAELYLNLMKFRYEDQFNFYLNVDSSMNADVIYMNKLVLQPLLENCFQHGFKNVLPIWNIMVNCYTLENYWYISVSDNGGGITNEQIQNITDTVSTFTENLSDSISQLTLGGMGLVNTLTRLKLDHSNDVSYTITHNYPTGTIITIKGALPHEYICN